MPGEVRETLDAAEAACPFGRVATRRDIERLYEIILHRRPECPAVVAEHLHRAGSVAEIIEILASSDEAFEVARQLRAASELVRAASEPGWSHACPPPERDVGRDAPVRVLCFGAYGNGNLGDAAQAEALAALIHLAAETRAEVDLCSWIDHVPFAAGAGRIVPPGTILDAAALGGYDLLVIGGGGLLGTPHFPLLDDAWIDLVQRRLRLPYALFGVGVGAPLLADPETRPAARRLIAGAAWVGVRHAEDVPLIAPVRGDAALVPDPVLCREVLAGGFGGDAVGARDIDILFVAKAPVDAAEDAFLDAVLRTLTEVGAAGRAVAVAVLEPQIDGPALRGAGAVLAPEGWPEFRALCGRSRLVISMRYHGCVAALSTNSAVVGGSAPKIARLLEHFPDAAAFVDDADRLAAALRLADGVPPRDRRGACLAGAAQAVAALRPLLSRGALAASRSGTPIGWTPIPTAA